MAEYSLSIAKSNALGLPDLPPRKSRPAKKKRKKRRVVAPVFATPNNTEAPSTATQAFVTECVLEILPAASFVPQSAVSCLENVKACQLRPLERSAKDTVPSATPILFSIHINTLPVELFSEIFVLCLPSSFQLRTCRREAPLVLGRVCRYWRYIALSITELWFCFPSLRLDGKLFAHERLMAMYFRRARQRPLKIEMTPMLNSSRVMRAFLEYVGRWKTFSITMDRNLAKVFGEMAKPPLLLETLDVTISFDDYGDVPLEEHLKVPLAIQKMAGLRNLTWQSRSIVPSTFLYVPLPQLTRLELSCPLHLDDCVAIVRRCQQLVDFVLDCKVPFETDTPLSERPCIPTLLSLSVTTYTDIGKFLERFRFPSLRSLVVNHRRVSPRRDMHAFEGFFTRSRCSLDKFHLRDRCLDQDGVIGYITLPCLQSIRELYVLAAANNRMIRLLTYPAAQADHGTIPHTEYLLPCLEDLTLGPCRSDDGLVAKMFESRLKPVTGGVSRTFGASLVKARAILCRTGKDKYPHDEDVAGFKKLLNKELKIYWVWR